MKYITGQQVISCFQKARHMPKKQVYDRPLARLEPQKNS